MEEITEQGYCDGNSCLPFEWEDEIHLWTIQNARDGDVLASKDGDDILIFKNFDSNINFSSYYNIIRSRAEICWANMCFIPATKEQRDALMKAMANAGYTFDFEKKELKKIEPKTLDADKVIEWLTANVRLYASVNFLYGSDCPQGDVEVESLIKSFKKDFGL